MCRVFPFLVPGGSNGKYLRKIIVADWKISIEEKGKKRNQINFNFSLHQLQKFLVNVSRLIFPEVKFASFCNSIQYCCYLKEFWSDEDSPEISL